MIRSWPEIDRFYDDLCVRLPNGPFRRAVQAINGLSRHIGEGPLASSLFGWTTMHDLCIQQTDAEPRSGPFLQLGPQPDGEVEFRFHDTAIAARQWSRRASPEGVIERFEAFLIQLRWTAL